MERSCSLQGGVRVGDADTIPARITPLLVFPFIPAVQRFASIPRISPIQPIPYHPARIAWPRTHMIASSQVARCHCGRPRCHGGMGPSRKGGCRALHGVRPRPKVVHRLSFVGCRGRGHAQSATRGFISVKIIKRVSASSNVEHCVSANSGKKEHLAVRGEG